jgi:hypothetical protein
LLAAACADSYSWGMNTEWPKEGPNDEPGTCDRCGEPLQIGEGDWLHLSYWRQCRLYHRDKTVCLTGWVYIAPECGPDRDLIKIGQAADLTARMSLLWNDTWRLRGPDVRTFWAVKVHDPMDSERQVLKALYPFRAYLFDPAHPFYEEWRSARPHPPEDASIRERLAWIYERQEEVRVIRRAMKAPKSTPGWTELFRCGAPTAIDVASAALGLPFLPFKFDHLSTDLQVERC